MITGNKSKMRNNTCNSDTSATVNMKMNLQNIQDPYVKKKIVSMENNDMKES